MPEKDVLPTLAKEYGKWIAHNFQASAAPNVPGGIHIRGEKIAFTVAVPPTADGSPMRTAAWLIADVDGRTVETLPAQEFSKSNTTASWSSRRPPRSATTRSRDRSPLLQVW